MKQILVKDVPAELLAELNRASLERGQSVTATVMAALAQRFNVRPRSDTGAPHRPVAGPDLALELPSELHMRVKVEAAAEDATMRGIILASVAEYLGLPPQSELRRDRRRVRGAA